MKTWLDGIYEATRMKTNESNEIVKNRDDWRKHILGIIMSQCLCWWNMMLMMNFEGNIKIKHYPSSNNTKLSTHLVDLWRSFVSTAYFDGQNLCWLVGMHCVDRGLPLGRHETSAVATSSQPRPRTVADRILLEMYYLLKWWRILFSEKLEAQQNQSHLPDHIRIISIMLAFHC